MTNEQWYFDILKRIASYDSLEKIEKTAEKNYGLTPHEVLEMAYENVLLEAKSAVKGKRRPKDK